MARDQFIDAATGETYTWELNHEAEEAAARQRTIQVSQPTAAGWQQVSPVRQQGEGGPYVRRFTGTVATATQHAAFLKFWQICASRSIIFQVTTGERLEVIIRSYQPGRKRVITGPRGARTYIWKYTMELEIVSVVS